MISVRQTGDLPAPSFRFRLTADTLGVQLYPSRCRADSGLSPVRNVRRRAHSEAALPILVSRAALVESLIDILSVIELLLSILSSKFSAPSFLSVSVKAILHAPLLLFVSNIPSQRQPAFAVFCGLCIASPSYRFKDCYCSVLPEKNFGTMTSADFLQPSRTSLHGLGGCQSICPSPQLQDLPD